MGFPITQNAPCLTKPFPPSPKVRITIIFKVSLKDLKPRRNWIQSFCILYEAGTERGWGEGVLEAIRKWENAM